jgi:hypothetical protein
VRGRILTETLPRLLIDLRRLVDHLLSLIQSLQLRMRQSQTQGYNEVAPTTQLGDLLGV